MKGFVLASHAENLLARHAILLRVAGTRDEPLKTSAWEASFVCAEAVLFNKTEMIVLDRG